MKVLHCGYFASIPVGIRKQLNAECEASKRKRIAWSTVFWSEDCTNECWHCSFPDKFKGPIRRKLFFAKWLSENHKYYDVVLLRYPEADVITSIVSKKIPQLYLFHHSKVLPSLFVGKLSVKKIIKMSLEFFSSRIFYSAAKGVVGITDDVRKHESRRSRTVLRSTAFSNGVNIQDLPLLEDEDHSSVNYVMVASKFAEYHGLEYVYKLFDESRELGRLHVVGIIPEKLHKNVSAHGNGENIKCYGLVDTEELYKIYQRCDIGLGSFNLAIKGHTQGCHLKVMEYLAMGLPVISGAPENGIPIDFKYLLVSQVNDPNAWKQYADNMRMIPRKHIRNASIDLIDKEALIEKQFNWLVGNAD